MPAELALFGVRDLVVKFDFRLQTSLPVPFDHLPTLQSPVSSRIEAGVLRGRCRPCSTASKVSMIACQHGSAMAKSDAEWLSTEDAEVLLS